MPNALDLARQQIGLRRGGLRVVALRDDGDHRRSDQHDDWDRDRSRENTARIDLAQGDRRRRQQQHRQQRPGRHRPQRGDFGAAHQRGGGGQQQRPPKRRRNQPAFGVWPATACRRQLPNSAALQLASRSPGSPHSRTSRPDSRARRADGTDKRLGAVNRHRIGERLEVVLIKPGQMRRQHCQSRRRP